MSLRSLTENEKGYLPAESSLPHAFGGNPGGIRMDPRLKHSGDGFEAGTKSTKFRIFIRSFVTCVIFAVSDIVQ